jgi:serine/threonine-protein kinase
MAPEHGSPGRYEVLFKLASGGMGTVYVGMARGAMGFRQIVAIKELHGHLADDKAYRKELVSEAHLASLMRHVNVVGVRDIEATGRQLRLVMDYIEGASLTELIVAAVKAGGRLPPGVVVQVALDAAAGLHAAHTLVDQKGRAVGLVHRDVSPQNILVGVDGTARVSDFGIAKALAGPATTTGALKGKVSYMSPEYLDGKPIDRRADVFALGVVVWEALAGERLFTSDNDIATGHRVLAFEPPLVSSRVGGLGADLDAVVSQALAKNPDQRFSTAAAFASALLASAREARLVMSHEEVAGVVRDLAGPVLEERRAHLRAKLSDEPGLLSLMGQPVPSLASRSSGAGFGSTIIPPYTPEILSQVPPSESPATKPVPAPVDENDAREEESPSGLPRRRASGSMALLAVLGASVLGGLGALALRGSTPSSAATAPVGSSSAASLSIPSAAIASASSVPVVVPSTPPPAPTVARPARTPRAPRAPSPPPAREAPPPNPY